MFLLSDFCHLPFAFCLYVPTPSDNRQQTTDNRIHPSSIKYFDHNASRLTGEYHSAEVTGLHALLGRWLPAGGKVLEIGCGAGRDAAFMASLGCRALANSVKPAKYLEEDLIPMILRITTTSSENDLLISTPICLKPATCSAYQSGWAVSIFFERN